MLCATSILPYKEGASLREDTTERRIQGLRKLALVLDLIRGVDEEMQVQTIATLIEAAREEGRPMGVIGRQVGMSSSATSRNLNGLGERGWKQANGVRKPGLGLLEDRVSPTNYSEKHIYLSSKGTRFIDRIVDLLEKER